MAIGSTEWVLLDTNVLVAALDRSRTAHRAAVRLLEQDERALAIGDQSVREFLTAATRPVASNGLGLPAPRAVAVLEDLLDGVETLHATEGSTRRLVEMVRHGAVAGKQVHDANLVAVALENHAAVIVTDHGRHFERFADLIEIEPLAP